MPFSQVSATFFYREPAQSCPSYFFKVYVNIFLLSMSRSSKRLLSFSFSYQTAVRIYLLPLTCHMPCPSHPHSLDNSHHIGEQYRSLSSSLCSFLHSPVTPSLLVPNTLLNTLFSNTLSLRSSLSVTDQVSHPYKPTWNITVLSIPRTQDSVPHGNNIPRKTCEFLQSAEISGRFVGLVD